MLSFLSVIPILGPIIQGVVDVFNKRADISFQKQADTNKTELGKIKSKNETDVEVIKTRATVAIAFRDDLGLKLLRDVMIYPVAVWNLLYYWCLSFPQWAWEIKTPPEAMQYLPYAVVAFLFVNAFRGDK